MSEVEEEDRAFVVYEMYNTETLQLTDYIHPHNLGPIKRSDHEKSPRHSLLTGSSLPFSTAIDSSIQGHVQSDWLSLTSNAFRKHSIAADGADFSCPPAPPLPQASLLLLQQQQQYQHQLSSSSSSSVAAASASASASVPLPFATPVMMSNTIDPTGLWRRMSMPSAAQNKICALCLCRQPNTAVSRKTCGHSICQPCLATLPFSLSLNPPCPVCVSRSQSTQQDIQKPLLSPLETSQIGIPLNYLPQPETSRQSALPISMLSNHTSSDALPISPHNFPCLKLSNIPWDVSQNDIRTFFCHCRMPSPSVYAQSIHIMMDRTTGKTLSDAYVEFVSTADLRRAIDTRNQKPLKGRVVTATECTQDELLSIVFSKWRGKFCGISAIPPASDVVKSMSTAAGGGGMTCPPFITREEINSLLVVCKNYKLHFSRKCAERPFENIISVIAKYPWHQSYLISTMHRDHIFEMLKLSIESLRAHLSKDYVHIDPTLLERLTRAGLMCPAFTERQKLTLLQNARMECPVDLYHVIWPPVNVLTPSLSTSTTSPLFNTPTGEYFPNFPTQSMSNAPQYDYFAPKPRLSFAQPQTIHDGHAHLARSKSAFEAGSLSLLSSPGGVNGVGVVGNQLHDSKPGINRPLFNSAGNSLRDPLVWRDDSEKPCGTPGLTAFLCDFQRFCRTTPETKQPETEAKTTKKSKTKTKAKTKAVAVAVAEVEVETKIEKKAKSEAEDEEEDEGDEAPEDGNENKNEDRTVELPLFSDPFTESMTSYELFGESDQTLYSRLDSVPVHPSTAVQKKTPLKTTRLSPWATSYMPASTTSDIWKTPPPFTSSSSSSSSLIEDPPVEENNSPADTLAV
ncbi:hypothetical protein F4703DRAFT_1939642 [Phycomyces blakesleeanus]